jgi:hypothetical protein
MNTYIVWVLLLLRSRRHKCIWAIHFQFIFLGWRSDRITAIMQDIISELKSLRESTQVVLQWIPSHCGIDGNELADSLSRVGSCLAQHEHSVNFCEANNNHQKQTTNWMETQATDRQQSGPSFPPAKTGSNINFSPSNRTFQTESILHRLGLIDTDECSCRNGVQSTEHFRPECNTHKELRQMT